MKNIVFLNSHPIQYFAPLYKAISQKTDISLRTFFCSQHGLLGEKDEEFGVNIKWDIPILEGYKYDFLKNHSPRPGIYSFFGLINLGIISRLFKMPKSAVVVHGWGYFSNVLMLVIAKLAGHIVCLRGESPMSHEKIRTSGSLKKRNLFFKIFLFKIPDYFLFIGSENKAFYKNYGVKEEQLIFAPYCVDNNRFSEEHRKHVDQKNQLKKELNFPTDKYVLFFSGKYIDKKRPLDLLIAFNKCEKKEKGFLVFMGDGEQRKEMENFIEKNNLKNVRLTGFVNQSKVPEYYAAADVFVMCSKEGETWGLSTNEAMNFELPILLSDLTGSSSDLVEEEKNGYKFKTFDTDDLASKLDLLFGKSKVELKEMGKHSKKIIQKYSYEKVIEGLQTVFIKSNKYKNRKLKTTLFL